MASINLELDEELGAVLEGLGQPVEQAAREFWDWSASSSSGARQTWEFHTSA
jgi:hypothetical protein